MPIPRFEAARLLGERLRLRRKELGLSQYDLSHLSGIDLTNYGKVERGIGNPTLLTILQLAVSLELDPAELIDELARPELLPEQRRPFPASDFVRERRLHAAQPQ